MQQLAFKAYGAVQRRTANDKEIEYALFRQVTDALDAVASAKNPSPHMLADVVHWNLQVWTALSVDLVHPGNRLEADTRKRLFALSDFVRRHSGKVLSEQASIAELIEINKSIMQGLRDVSASPSEQAVA